MRVVRAFSIIIAVLAPVSAWAFRPRPVSDLRFENQGTSYESRSASDGRDVMVLSTDEVSVRDDHAYVQKVEGGIPAGPRLEIGRGRARGIAWTGSEYLAAISNVDGLRIARVSREGSLIEAPSAPVVPGESTFFAAGERSAMAIRYEERVILAQPLGLTGRPSGIAVESPAPGRLTQLFAVREGFIVVFTGFSTEYVLLRGDGTPLTPPTVIDGPYPANGPVGFGAVVSSDGDDTAIVFEVAQPYAEAALKSVVIGPDGTLKRSARTLRTVAKGALDPLDIVWDGSQHVVLLSLEDQRYSGLAVPALLRINRSGDALAEPERLTISGHGQAKGLAWNGSELHVICKSSVMIPATGRVLPLGRTLNRQHGLTLAASNEQYLAAWFESAADGVMTVRASRIDAAGTFLDGAGIVLGVTQEPPLYVEPTIAIDSDGVRWLVVWAAGGVHGMRLSPAGSKLDAQPLTLGLGWDVTVRWNGSRWIVLVGEGRLRSIAVSADGVVAPANDLAVPRENGMSFRNASLVVANGRTLALFDETITSCGPIQPVCGTYRTRQGLRLNDSGTALDPAPFPIANVVLSTREAAATNGTMYLVVWQADAGIFGAFSPVDAPQAATVPFQIQSRASEPSVTFDGSDFIVVWNTPAHTIGYARIRPDGEIVDRQETGGDGNESARPVVAADAKTPPLIGFEQTYPAYDSVSRAAALFPDELTTFHGGPAAPTLVTASRLDHDLIGIRWQKPASSLLGISIELQLPDSSWRQIGTASGQSSGTFAFLSGFEGFAIRLRAWNLVGLSEPSSPVPITIPARRRAVR